MARCCSPSARSGTSASCGSSPGSPATVTALNDIGQTIVPLLIAAPLAARAARRSTGRLRTSWWLLAAAAPTWGLGQAVWTWFEVVLGEEVPYPGLGGRRLPGLVPLLLAGVLVFPSLSLRAWGRARAVVDGLITTAPCSSSATARSWGRLHDERGQLIERAIAVTYPVADVVTVSVVIAVLARRSVRLAARSRSWPPVSSSLAVADSAFAFLTAQGTYGSDPITDVGWPLGFALIAYAAWLPGGEAAGVARERSASSHTPLLAYIPVVPAIAVFVGPVVRGAGLRSVPRPHR